MYRECTEMVTPHIQCGHAVLISQSLQAMLTALGKQGSPIEISRDYTPFCTSPSVFIYNTTSVVDSVDLHHTTAHMHFGL